MKFLIQKVNGQVKHDFAFILIQSVGFNNWLHSDAGMRIKYLNTKFIDPISEVIEDNMQPIEFKPSHKNCVPVGSVEFVKQFLLHFHSKTLFPTNVPKELQAPCYSGRMILDGNFMDLENLNGEYFAKSNSRIKSTVYKLQCPTNISVPVDHYQISEVIQMDSEWRAFIYEGQLLGLQNYSGDYTMMPNIDDILYMIGAWTKAPVAYTLDVCVNPSGTFVVECHDFYSCGLYGFADHGRLPFMFYRWFMNYIKKDK
jgi:hypothetical protein